MSTFEIIPFYRGFSRKHSIDRPSVIVPRRNRRPKNSPAHFHNIADEWFRKRFGIQYRSQGVFVTSSIVAASSYAESPDYVMRVIPIDAYAYCWSPKISDLLFAANSMKSASRDEIESYLDSALYRDSELQNAHSSGHEVMLWCERYVAIPAHLLGDNLQPDRKSIILANG